MQLRGMLWGAALVASTAAACGDEVVNFVPSSGGAGPGGAGGSTASNGGTATATGTATGTSTSTSSQGGAGGQMGCTMDADCAVATPCLDALCTNGVCSNPLEPAGTPCGAGGEVCDDMGNCGLPGGAPCMSGTECLSANCVDGVCCDTACTGTCEACDVMGSLGTCTPHAAGTDPDLECMGGVCDGGGSCANGNALWAQRFGNSSTQTGHGLAVDSAGNVIICGFFYGAIDFGGGALVSAGNSDVFVAKLDTAGNHIWSFRFGGASDSECWRVAVDAMDNVILAGHFFGSIDFGGGPLNSLGQRDVYVAKLSSGGAYQWASRHGNASDQAARGLAVGPAGIIGVSGYAAGSIDFGGGAITSAGNYDAYAAVLDATGAHVWSDGYGSTGDDRSYGIAFDSSSNAHITGFFGGSVNFGGGTLTSLGGDEIFVAKLNNMGVHQWSSRFGNGANQEAREVVVDGAGNVWLGGAFEGAIDFGGGAITSGGGYDVCVAKLSSTGAHLFSDGYSGGGDDGVRGLTVDASNNVIVSGYMQATVDFGGGPLTSLGSYDAYLLKLTSTGTHLWSQIHGSASLQAGYGVDTNTMGEIFTVGYFFGSIGFGATTLTSFGNEDVYLAKLSP